MSGVLDWRVVFVVWSCSLVSVFRVDVDFYKCTVQLLWKNVSKGSRVTWNASDVLYD